MKIHYVYKTTCLLTGRYYVGMHTTKNFDDGYIGSGKILKRSIVKYGIAAHKKEILHVCDTREELIQLEKDIVNEDLLRDPLSMNIRLGGEGGGGWTSTQQKENNKKSQRAQKILRETDSVWLDKKARKTSEANLRDYQTGKRKRRQPLDWTGRKHREDTRRLMSSIKKGIGIGHTNSNAKQVQDSLGRIFLTINDCAKYYNIHPGTVSRRIKRGIYILVPKEIV